jgi:hypothetical protein
MLRKPPKPREIVRQGLFDQELMLLGLDSVSADEFTEGAEWVLHRNAEYGTKISKNVWFLPISRSSLGVSASLYYTFDDKKVYFLSIQRAPEEVEE